MKNTVYVLTETFEGTDNIREFQIINVYKNEDEAIKSMEALIESDIYGIIKKNCIYSYEKYNFSTNYVDGFLEYSIGTYQVN